MTPEENRERLEQETADYFASLTPEMQHEENALAAALSAAAHELDYESG